jgi:RND superfamily putative drug exporter
MKIVDTILHRRKEIIAAWVVAFLAISPAILGYTKFLSYSSNSSALSDTESAKVQKILQTSQPQNSSLTVVSSINVSSASDANSTLSFQDQLHVKKIPFYSSSDSVYSEYASFINRLASNYRPQLLSLMTKLNQTAFFVYRFADIFLEKWRLMGYNRSSIQEAALLANASYPESSAFISIFTGYLESGNQENKVNLVQDAARMAALETSSKQDLFFVAAASSYLNITDYRGNLDRALSKIVSNLTGQNINSELIHSIISSNDPGLYYVKHFGLLGVPGFILQRYVSNDNTTQVIYVYFNVTESFRGPNNPYPSQDTTPVIRELAKQYLGTNSLVTGQGAIAYDSQQLASGSGYVFGLTFLFLAVAVGLTLGSLISPLIALLFVSLSTALGYLSITLTGLIFGSVDFTVTYTLTAVILGVTTDYVVFLLSRFKEELRAGKNKEDALKTALRRAGEAVLISGITVAGSLGALSFLPDLRTWGPVLLSSVLLSVLLVVTLLPVSTYYIGPRIFTKKTLKAQGSSGWIYRAARFSSKRRKVVVLLFITSFIPSFYIWATLPTTYNISEGLPSGLESVKAYSILNQKFGADVIFPVFVLKNLSSPLISVNGSLPSSTVSELNNTSSLILSSGQVERLVGPYGNGSSLSYNFVKQFQIGS